MRSRDLSGSIFCFLVGLAFTFGGGQLGIGQWRAPGPGFFPVFFGGTLSGLSIILFMITLLTTKMPTGQISFWKEKNSWEKVSFSLLALILYMLLLNYLGYLLTSYLLMNYLIKFIGKKGWTVSVVLAILISLVSYLVFQVGLEVPLPRGIFKIS